MNKDRGSRSPVAEANAVDPQATTTSLSVLKSAMPRWQPFVGQESFEAGTDNWLDGAAAPGCPGSFESCGDRVATAAIDFGDAPLQEVKPEPQVRVLERATMVRVTA